MSCCGSHPSATEEETQIVVEKMIPSIASKPKTSIPANEIAELFPSIEGKGKVTTIPPLDAFFDTKAECLVILLDVPGFGKDDVSIEIGEGMLNIEGSKSGTELRDKYGEDIRILAHERSTGFFMRTFQLPSNAMEDSVEANLTKGLLEVRIKCIQTHDKRPVEILDAASQK